VRQLEKLYENIKLANYQQRIYEGLKQIGGEIAAFYLDGIKIYQSKLTTKSYLLAHIAREIECGLRDIFASDVKQKKEKYPTCGREKRENTHIDEICRVIQVDKESEFAKKWHGLAKKFHKYAHRHGPWKDPRNQKEFDALWEEFEKYILYKLVGGYLNLISRVDGILTMQTPTEEVLGTLHNLFKNKAISDYFFKNLDHIEWFIPLKEQNYFSPKNAPGPEEIEEEGVYRIPQWNVLPYLERVSEKVNIPGNEKYIAELLDIIRNVTQYHIDNYRTWWYFVKILLNIPNDKIPIDIIELIPTWLDSKFKVTLPEIEISTRLLPKFLNSDNPEDIKKAEKIIEIITNIKRVEGRPKTVVSTYRLIQVFKKHGAKVGEKCSENIIFNIADKLKEIFKQESPRSGPDGSYIWFPSLFSDPEVGLYEVKETLTFILRDITLAKCSRDLDAAKRIFEKFLGTEYQYCIFKRIVLFVIGNRWDSFKDKFWEIIDAENGKLFDDPYFEPEIYNLLKRNLSKFKDKEKEKIKSIIEKGPQHLPTGIDKQKYIAGWKQKWYSVLKRDSYFAPLYKKYKKISGIKKEEFSFETKFETRVGPDPSPLAKEEILRMSNETLSKFLKEFRTKDSWKGPTVGGLADVLKEAVKQKPEKFIEDLNPFLNTHYLYVYKILDGIKEAWNEKKLIEWSKLLNFIEKYINREDFWNDKFIIRDEEWPASHANHRWVVASVAELLQEGAKNDIWAFPEEYFDQAKKIIFLMLEKLTIEENKEEIHDFVTHALNSAFGKVITALIFLALRIARVNKKKGIKEEVKWSNDFRDKYNELLKKGVIEAYTLLGQYMANLYYLDKEWVKDKIKELKNKQGTKCWEAFMDGYLFGVRVYDELYRLMKSHYLYSIEYNFKERHMEERLIQHIAIEYLRGHEDIDDTESLFKKVLDTWKTEYIKEIISFFWIQRDYKEDENIKEKIINFWRWIYENKYKEVETLTKEDKEILSDLSKLTVFLPKIDNESFNWLMTSAPYVHVNFNSPFFIEYLDNLKDKDSNSPKYVGKIFLKMLESFTPDYDQKHIRSIVENLYNSGQKAIAGKICNIYGSRGYEFLRDIYKKHQE